MPKKLWGSVSGLSTGKIVCLRIFVAQQGGLGAGKMVRIRNFVAQ